MPLGIAIAWLLARRNFPGKTLLDGVIHLPLVLPPVVVGYLLLVFLGRKGILGAPLYKALGISFAFNWKGAAVASAVVAFPLLVRAIRLSIEAVDQGLEAAARTLGAGPVRVFFTITIPLVAPGILTGIILAFARSLSEFGATITFVSNIPGQTENSASCFVHADSGSRRGRRGRQIVRNFSDRGLAGSYGFRDSGQTDNLESERLIRAGN